MINIGKYIEMAINWLTDHFASFFDALSIGIGGFIDGFQHVLFGIPFYITILALAILAWFKAGKGVAVFTLSGLLLVYGMGLGRDDADTCLGAFFYLSGFVVGSTDGNLDGKQ